MTTSSEKLYNLAEPWTRQPCDTEGRWLAFQAFRDCPPPRSLGKAAKAVGKARHVLNRWSQDCAWMARVQAYDRMRDSVVQAEVMDMLGEDARERAHRHIEVLRDMQDAGALLVKAWLKKIKHDPEGFSKEWTPQAVTNMIKESIKLERLIHGESTENIDARVAFDLSKLTIDEIKLLRSLEAKATTGKP